MDRLPSKSLEAGILDPENLTEASEHMSTQPSSALLDQIEVAFRNVVHVADNTGYMKEPFVGSLKDSMRCAKAIALVLSDHLKLAIEALETNQEKFKRLEASNSSLKSRCSKLENEVVILKREIGRLKSAPSPSVLAPSDQIVTRSDEAY